MAGRLERRLADRAARLTLRSAVLLIVGVAATLAVVSAALERLVDPAFTSSGDALWWAVATVTTVGYGDVVPESSGGRVIAAGLMLVGLGLIPLTTSVVVSTLAARWNREAREAALRDLADVRDRLERIEGRLDAS